MILIATSSAKISLFDPHYSQKYTVRIKISVLEAEEKTQLGNDEKFDFSSSKSMACYYVIHHNTCRVDKIKTD